MGIFSAIISFSLSQGRGGAWHGGAARAVDGSFTRALEEVLWPTF